MPKKIHKLTYSPEARELIASMKGTRPDYVWHDGLCQTTFTYEDHFVVGVHDSVEAATQNDSDEAIIVRFTRNDGTYQREDSDTEIVSGQSVERVWLLRTLLYFTDFRAYRSSEEALADTDLPDNDSPITSKLRDLVSGSIGGYEERVCHPDSKEAADVDPQYSNLVDAGALFQLGTQLLAVFSPHNAFGNPQIKYSLKELRKDVVPFYKMIEL